MGNLCFSILFNTPWSCIFYSQHSYCLILLLVSDYFNSAISYVSSTELCRNIINFSVQTGDAFCNWRVVMSPFGTLMNTLNRLGEMGTVLDLSENDLWSNWAKQNKEKKIFSASIATLFASKWNASVLGDLNFRPSSKEKHLGLRKNILAKVFNYFDSLLLLCAFPFSVSETAKVVALEL